MKAILYLSLILVICILQSGCKSFQPDVMLRTPKDFAFDSPPDSTKQYRIHANDLLRFRLFSNNGFRLIDVVTDDRNTSMQLQDNRREINYLVEYDGKVKLPGLGRVDIEGKTLRQAELDLEKLYSKDVQKPFVLLEVINQRVTVFPGEGGQAVVITLQNENTTLIEALAIAGGISKGGKAKKVKLIRGDRRNPEIFLLDLSTIEGIEKSDIVLQANDIIYVEPQFNLPRELLSEITPVISIMGSTLTLIWTARLIRTMQ